MYNDKMRYKFTLTFKEEHIAIEFLNFLRRVTLTNFSS